MRKQANLYKWGYRTSIGLTILSFLSIFVISLTLVNIVIALVCVAVFYGSALYLTGKASDIERDIQVLILCHIRK